MSLEANIQKLTDAVTQLILVIESQKLPVVQLPVVEQVAPVPVVMVPPAPVAVAAPVFTPPPVAAAPVMPPPPVFTAPAQVAPAVTGLAPFNDAKGLIEYVMAAYKAMGAAKGAGIQGVLGTLGYQNINDVAPAHYAALYAGIEGLK